jgi:AraC-like DNA-binding protein
MDETPADRILDLATLGAPAGLPTTLRIAWERSGHGYYRAPGGWHFHQISAQITLRGLGRCWPTGGVAAVDLPPGHALIYDNRLHRRLAYGRAAPGEPYEFLYINLVGEGAAAAIRDLAALHHHAVPLGVAHPLIRDAMALLPARDAHETWPLARSAAFAQRLLLAFTEAGTAAAAPPSADRLVAQAMALLAADDATVAEVATALGLSREHLARVFAARTGEPPARWRRRQRLERAARRLLAGEAVAAVARASGFATPAHFSAAFRAYAGSTPSRFRSRGAGPPA